MLCRKCNNIIAGPCYIQSNKLGETEDILCKDCCNELGIECTDSVEHADPYYDRVRSL